MYSNIENISNHNRQFKNLSRAVLKTTPISSDSVKVSWHVPKGVEKHFNFVANYLNIVGATFQRDVNSSWRLVFGN